MISSDVTGIIAEYNFFHNGHAKQLSIIKERYENTKVVAVMSGNFTQRGEAAFLNKWKRAELAVRAGVDLVIELPFVYATSSAEIFASGGVGILEGLGIVDRICFGSETARTRNLTEIAEVLCEDTRLDAYIKRNMDAGNSFAAARQAAVEEILGRETSELKNPNDILAIEYIKALMRRHGEMEIFPIARRTGDHIATASEIRNYVKNGTFDDDMAKLVPAKVIEHLKAFVSAEYSKRTGTCDMIKAMDDKLFLLARFKLITEGVLSMKDIYEVSEGLENRLSDFLKKSIDMEEFVQGASSKRYTKARIRRALLFYIIGLRRDEIKKIIENDILYARPLAFNEDGAKLLKRIHKTGKIRVVGQKKCENEDEKLFPVTKYDILATELYELEPARGLYKTMEYMQKPFVG